MSHDHDPSPRRDADPAARARLLHERAFGRPAAAAAEAPGTFSLIGEDAAPAGGTAIIGKAPLAAAVALAAREDDAVVVVDERSPDSPETLSSEDVARIQDSQQPGVDDEGRRTFPGPPDGGRAARLAGLAGALYQAQLRGRGRPGLTVAVASDVPDDPALGPDEALLAALAAALAAGEDPAADPPVSAQAAALAARSAATFGPGPVIAARIDALLRTAGDPMASVSAASGAAMATSSPLGRRVRGLLALPGDGSRPDPKGLRERDRFLAATGYAFGTRWLTDLPDYRTRVPAWLEALAAMGAADDLPEPPLAAAWLERWSDEAARARRAESMLRSRKNRELWALVRESATGLAAAEPDAAGDEAARAALSAGALSARRALSGGSRGLVVAAPEARLPTARAALEDLGWECLSLDGVGALRVYGELS